jgi:UDP-N-acetylglucosamine 2-epimerase (non-hydrolysing)
MAGQWKKGAIPPLWDGKAAERIVGQLERLLIALQERGPAYGTQG